jgi:SNF2 family DNA or RNA helicase
MSWEWARSLGSFEGINIDFFIADEVHRAANRESAQAAAYHSACKATFDNPSQEGRCLAMSGTTSGNRLTGMFSVAQGLWPERYHSKGTRGGNTYWKWCKANFFEEVNSYTGLPEYKREKQVGNVRRDLPWYIKHEQGVACCEFHPRGVQEDLPKRVPHYVGVELSATQRKLYKEMDSRRKAWVDGYEIPVTAQDIGVIEHLRLLQICLAEPVPEMWQEFDSNGELVTKHSISFPLDTKSTKINALLEIIADELAPGETMIVWTHSRAVIPAIVHQINKRFKGEHVARNWDGTVAKKIRNDILDTLGQDGAPNIIVAQIESLAEGVDGLQLVCYNEVWFSQSANLTQNKQSLGRLVREGQKYAVNSWFLQALDTIEEEKDQRLAENSELLEEGLHA